jgi:hypothetical protein
MDPQLQEPMFKTFIDVVKEGCFFCGDDSVKVLSTHHEYDNCIDVCSKHFITREAWSSVSDEKDNLRCSTVILTAMGDLASQNWFQASDATNFVDNLVYDD